MSASSGAPGWNPLRLFRNSRFSYQQIPPLSSETLHGAIHLTTERLSHNSVAFRERWRRGGFGRLSLTKSISLAIAIFVLLSLLVGGGYRRRHMDEQKEEEDVPYYWMHFHRLNGYFNGIRTLVPYSEVQVDNGYNKTIPLSLQSQEQVVIHKEPPVEPVRYDPYPEYTSDAYLKEYQGVKNCYLDAEEKIRLPDVYAYPGVPQNIPQPLFGDYKNLGLEEEMCFERFGRYGAYGFGYDEKHSGLGPGLKSEKKGSEKVFEQGFIDYSKVDWGSAQRRCFEKNKVRFKADPDPFTNRKRVPRQAYILRTWTGYEYTPHQLYALRAMITELSLQSGGEYDVHLLVHVKNDSIPIWADKGVYQNVIEENVPQEFWNISTLWSEQQMKMYYPGPFPGNFARMVDSTIHSVYRSPHFPLQWFAQQHPEYDFFWNWEMDIRYQGHYYELHSRVGEWAKQQPRKGMWERARRFYIPAYHGDWQNFTKMVERETKEVDRRKNDERRSGPVPVWGPANKFKADAMLEAPDESKPPRSYEQDDYEWGVGEEADLMTFNPIFDPSTTNWVFESDVSGYNTDLPIPPRRAAIITVARLSKRLLDTMHRETWAMKHNMFPEMWPPTVAFHHGFKAVFIPHPVYFDRDWDVAHLDQVYNHPVNVWDSPFGWGEHNSLGSTFYYNSGFSSMLWRRWLGQREEGAGGKKFEEAGTGRLCLRPLLHHPIKREDSPETG